VALRWTLAAFADLRRIHEFLEPVSPTSDLRRIPDDSSSQPATNLYSGLRASAGVYRFEWIW